MPGQTHQIQWCQLVKTLMFIGTKNQLHLSILSLDMTRFYKFVTVGTLDMTGHVHQIDSLDL